MVDTAIREAVAVFHDEKSLQSAVDSLLIAGFDRSHLSLLAGEASIEQVGWDGRVRPQSARRHIRHDWPEALEPLSDTYIDQVFQGPLG
jgi:hypothetical protein